MTTLHLGVIVQNYRTFARVYRYRGKTGKPGRRRVANYAASLSTLDVANFLEDRYHVMENFYELHQEEIVGMIANAYAGAVETAMHTGRPPIDLEATGINRIKKLFNDFLDMEELAGLGIPGVPTQAAKDGVSHRFKHPYAAHARRPSFIDTGLYESSFVAWVD